MPQVSELLPQVSAEINAAPSSTNSQAGEAPPSSQALRSELVERLFARLLSMYGNRFVSMWEGVDAQTMKDVWAQGLAGYRASELMVGLNTCLQSHDWPPTLPQFRALCRPRANHEVMFREAAFGRYATPLAYHAARRLGFDVVRTTPYREVRAAWVAIVDELLLVPDLPPIPEAEPVALPAPGKTYTPEKAASAVAAMRDMLRRAEG